MEWHESSAKMMICRALRRKKKAANASALLVQKQLAKEASVT